MIVVGAGDNVMRARSVARTHYVVRLLQRWHVAVCVVARMVNARSSIVYAFDVVWLSSRAYSVRDVLPRCDMVAPL